MLLHHPIKSLHVCVFIKCHTQHVAAVAAAPARPYDEGTCIEQTAGMTPVGWVMVTYPTLVQIDAVTLCGVKKNPCRSQKLKVG